MVGVLECRMVMREGGGKGRVGLQNIEGWCLLIYVAYGYVFVFVADICLPLCALCFSIAMYWAIRFFQWLMWQDFLDFQFWRIWRIHS